MKRHSILSGTLLVGSAIVAGCGHAPSLASAHAPAAALQSAALHTGNLRVRATIDPFRVQDLAGGGYTLADVATVTLTVSDKNGNVLATQTLDASDVNDQITFSNLPLGEVVVLAQARDANGNLISTDADSQTTVDVTSDGTNVVSLLVQLADKTQPTMNATFNGIDVIPGDLLSPGPVTISTSSAPTTSTSSGSASTSSTGTSPGSTSSTASSGSSSTSSTTSTSSGSGSSATSTASGSTSTSGSTSATSGSSTSSAPTWDASTYYTVGQEVAYNGLLWKCIDASQGIIPSSASWGSWSEVGPA